MNFLEGLLKLIEAKVWCQASCLLWSRASLPGGKNHPTRNLFLPPNPVHPVNPVRIRIPSLECYVKELVAFGKILFVPIVMDSFCVFLRASASPREVSSSFVISLIRPICPATGRSIDNRTQRHCWSRENAFAH